MSDLRDQVDEIGRRIWPDAPTAYRAMEARRRRWWLTFLQPRRPQLAMRWLPVLAAVATVAIFLAIAGAHPAQERTEGQGQHAVIPATPPSGSLDSRSTQLPLHGRGEPLAPTGRAVAGAPPAATSAPPPVEHSSAASPEHPPATGAQVAMVTLTEADSGRTITVSPGTRIVVTLQGSSHHQWTAPRTLDSAVVSAADSGRDAGGGAHGTFTAVHPGHTRLMAGQGGCHGPLCLIASATTWQVRIVVR
ncbi:MAG TPA: hypothetical protein VH134_04530 [Candidatus Dormibacteraeota bacterium]|jgi:hypothetical protein|nr:hypothetical protein [Candidatus Dormibacteraeota bacterium]